MMESDKRVSRVNDNGNANINASSKTKASDLPLTPPEDLSLSSPTDNNQFSNKNAPEKNYNATDDTSETSVEKGRNVQQRSEKEKTVTPISDRKAAEPLSALNVAEEISESSVQNSGIESGNISRLIPEPSLVPPHEKIFKQTSLEEKRDGSTIVNVASNFTQNVESNERLSDKDKLSEKKTSSVVETQSSLLLSENKANEQPSIDNGIPNNLQTEVSVSESTERQPTGEPSTMNEKESIIADSSESGFSAVKGSGETTLNGCNKENERRAMVLNEASVHSSANLSSASNGERVGNESLNNSEDESALVIDDHPEQDKAQSTESTLPLITQSTKVLPQTSPNVAVKAPVKPAKGRKSGTPRQPLKFDKEDLEHLRLPEKHGWKRELVYRGTFDQDSRKCDIYYHPPSGRKLRSMMDIGAYLDKQENYPLNRTHFTFRKDKLFEPPFEIVRSAGQPVKAFSSPNVNSKSKSSPSATNVHPGRRLAVKVPTPKASKPASGARKTFPRIILNTQDTRPRIISHHQQGNSNSSGTNGTDGNPTRVHEALQESLSRSNQVQVIGSSVTSHSTVSQQITVLPHTKLAYGFDKSNSNGASKDRPASSWKMKVTPRLNIKKARPRPTSPDWKPSSEESSNSEAEAEQDIEIIRQSAGDADGDEMQRVMGPASDLIASIVRQSQPQPASSSSYNLSTALNTGSGNKQFRPRLVTGGIQASRILAPARHRKVLVIPRPRQSLNTSVPLRSLLHPTTPSNLPIHILSGGYIQTSTSISTTSTGLTSTFPPPPPLASRPTFRLAEPPPLKAGDFNPPSLRAGHLNPPSLRAGALNPPPLTSMVPPPLLASPRAPPALQPCPSILDGPQHILCPMRTVIETRPPPPPLSHGPFAPNILQPQGSHKPPQKSEEVQAQTEKRKVIEDRSVVSVKSALNGGERCKVLPQVVSDASELISSSEEEEDVLCVSKLPQADSKGLAAVSTQRKRQASSESNSEDDDDPEKLVQKSKCIRLERLKSPEQAQANAEALKAVRNLVVNRAGKEDEKGGDRRESAQSPSALRSILNEPPKAKNVLPEVNDMEVNSDKDYDDDDDDEFLPSVSFATPPETPQVLPSSSETDQGEHSENSTSSVAHLTKEPHTQSNSSSSSNDKESTFSLSSNQMPVKSTSSNAQLLTLPCGLREKLNLNRPLLLTVNGQNMTIPPGHVLDNKDSLKVLIPSGTNMAAGGPGKTLSVSVSNLSEPSSISTLSKHTRGSHLRVSFRPLQECVGIMTRLFRFFTIPYLLRLSQVNKTWLRMLYMPDLWQTVSLRNIYVKDWDQARRFLQKVCVKKLTLSGMVLRRDLESQSWQSIQKIVPVLTTLTELHFGRVPANIIDSLMEKLPETVSVSADFIIDSNSNENKKATPNKWSEKHVDNMSNALSSVSSGMTPANAALLYNVAETDLLHLQQNSSYLLTPEEESLVVLCCMRLAHMGFSITISSFLVKCQEMFARRYSTLVPIPIFDGACRQIYQRNVPFFYGELSQGPAQSMPVKLDHHYLRLGILFDSICRPQKITPEQIYIFDIQPFRVMADCQTGSKRGSVTVTVLWSTDAGTLSVRPAMLVTPVELRSDQRHEKFTAVVAKNGIATPTHIQQYFRHIIASATKFPVVVLCSTDASNFSESLVSMCFQRQVYLINIQSDIAKFVFPGCQGGLLHMLKKQVPSMSMKQEEFLSRLKFLLEKCLLNIQMSTKLAFDACGVFPVNRRAPVQYQSKSMAELINGGKNAVEKVSNSAASSSTVSKLQCMKTSIATEQMESSSEFGESSSAEEVDEEKEDEANENRQIEEIGSSSDSDIEFVEETKVTKNVSLGPSSLKTSKQPKARPPQESAKSPVQQEQSSEKESGGGSNVEAESKQNKVKRAKFSWTILSARHLIRKAKRGPIERSTHKYKPLKPLKPASPYQKVIKKTILGKNVISTFAFNSFVLKTPNSTQQNIMTSASKVHDTVPPMGVNCKDLEKEPPSLIIDVSLEKKQKREPEMPVRDKSQPALEESRSKDKALVRKHMQEAIDAVVEESREYARQVERGGSHGVEIMPEKWMQREREKQAAGAVSGIDLKSTYVKRVDGTSIVLKTSSLSEQETQQNEEEESEEEEDEEDADEDEEAGASSNDEETEEKVEWTVSTQPKHAETKERKKKHKKEKKRKKYDSDEETSVKERRHKKKKSKKAKKKKHKKQISKSEPEEMDTSQDASPQKQVSNGEGNDRGVTVEDIPLRNNEGSTKPAITDKSVHVDAKCDITMAKAPSPVQPSYIADHDYFSRFVDEESIDMEKKTVNSPQSSAAEDKSMLGEGVPCSAKVAMEPDPASQEGTDQTSNEHDYSKSEGELVEEMKDVTVSGKDVEVEMVKGKGSASKDATGSDSCDENQSDSDSASSSNSSSKSSSDSSSDSSKISNSSSGSAEESSESEDEENEILSPKMKIRKESSSSEDSASSDSNSSDSESEEDKKKKKSSTSLETDDDENDESEEEDKCQLCMRSTPPHSKDVLINWVDCDNNCGRWFHVICIKNSSFRSKSKSKNPKHYICPSCR